MKKIIISLVSLMVAMLALVGCASSNDSKEQVRIGILQYVEHDALSAARKGFIAELEEQGYADGKNIQGDVIKYFKTNNRYRIVLVSPDTKKITLQQI